MRIETRIGAPIRHEERVLVPLARTLWLRLPVPVGALVWNRPLGVLVTDGKRPQFLRTPDRTRQIQWLLWAAGLATAYLLRRTRRRRTLRRRASRR
ncbi:MAG TPA: hypothetical protein VMR54_05190 [Thermoanaerobaculia bacterium]|nr:hypothetical protein [Thermoanaerobaculia bacterium]